MKLFLHYGFLDSIVNTLLTHLMPIKFYNFKDCFNGNNFQSICYLIQFIHYFKISCSSHMNDPVILNIFYIKLLICMSFLYSTFGSVCWNPCVLHKTKHNVQKCDGTTLYIHCESSTVPVSFLCCAHCADTSFQFVKLKKKEPFYIYLSETGLERVPESPNMSKGRNCKVRNRVIPVVCVRTWEMWVVKNNCVTEV